MNKFYSKYKHIINYILLFIINVVLIVCLYKLFFPTPEPDFSDIDTLNDKISVYKDSLEVLKSDRKLDELHIHDLEQSIKRINTQETKIIEIYHEKIKYIDRYTPNDATTYFNDRYSTDSILKR